jgi:hypothetical protein
VFCEKEEKKSKCPKKNFQSVKRGWRKKIISVEFRVFEKKIGRKISEEKIKVFLGKKS